MEGVMHLIEWTENMSVGVSEIDAEHQGLTEAVNRLYEAIEAGADKDELSRLLDALVVLTVSHFVHEERLFAKTSYPDREAHTSEHEDLKKQMVSIHDRFRKGETESLTPGFAHLLKSWLVEHILTMDMKYGGHLNANGVK
jgi:hemerythrin-like metal-binding protein